MPHLENFRLKVFRAVAENASFRKAGEELYLTQPAVTQQIRALEEDLGVQLFDRTGTRVEVTSTGSVLLRYVRQVDKLLARAEQEIAVLPFSIGQKGENCVWVCPLRSPNMSCRAWPG